MSDVSKCVVCDVEVPDYEPEFCCNAFDCGCRGMPIEPCICSEECWDKLMNRNKSTDEVPKVNCRKCKDTGELNAHKYGACTIGSFCTCEAGKREELKMLNAQTTTEHHKGEA